MTSGIDDAADTADTTDTADAADVADVAGLSEAVEVVSVSDVPGTADASGASGVSAVADTAEMAVAVAAAEPPAFRDQPLDWFAAKASNSFTYLTTQAIALYGTAVLRIGYGSLYLIFLLHEYPKHDALWGPNAPWTPALNQQFANDPGLDWFAVDRWWYTFLGHGGKTWFEFWYNVAILVCLLFVLGWRTRVTSICFALTIMAFTGRDVFLTDGGDNIMGLMAIYLAFSRCGARWSLDERRKRRQAQKRQARGIAEFSWPGTPGWQAVAELDRDRKSVV